MRAVGKLLICVMMAILLLTGVALAAEKVYYYHSDPAGTPQSMTDASGSVVWRGDYKPFGEEYQVTGFPENDKKFIGKEKDEETGLYYFGARYMEARIGRFVSPDPVGAVNPKTGTINQIVIHDPQRLNYYAYGLNNPYKYVDAHGEEPVSLTLAISGIVAYGPVIIKAAEAAVIILATYAAARTAVEVYEASKSERKEESKGGTYKLRDPETGDVKRTGQTKDLDRREKEHARNPKTKDLDFEVDRRSDDREARLGREQKIHDEHRGTSDLNKRNPISPNNPNRERYIKKGSEL
ncbi:MAG: hypothetical protein A2V86_08725 [Deltaproteobacteria bacterium RBG_16_49_23]|nr:MAG: hypothetical protein A2V86_08725 [Deltaproteobacteria bacterium RBG_16_49_23]